MIDDISRAELVDELESRNWDRVGGIEMLFETWSDGSHEVLVPSDPARGDYQDLLQHALRLLEGIYGAGAEEAVLSRRGLRGAGLDIARFGRSSALPPGWIYWNEGVSLYDAARSALSVAAKTTRSRLRYFGNSNSYIAKRFLEASIMGQTQVGSFVVTAYTPAEQVIPVSQSEETKSTSQNLDPIIQTTGRDIINTLSASLGVVRAATDEFARNADIRIFEESVKSGVSYELMKTLAALAGGSQESSVVLELSATLPAPETRQEFVFRGDEAPVFDHAATQLAQDVEPVETTLRGAVTLLSRPRMGEPGTISLDVVGRPEINKVRVRLAPEQYDLAWSAHHSGELVQVTGRLEREGNLWWLYEARDVTTLPGGIT